MKLLLSLLFIIAFSLPSYAQFNFGVEEEFYSEPVTTVGPWLTFAAGVNSNINPDGRKAEIGISSIPNFGFMVQVPVDLEAEAEMIANISYSNYFFKIKDARIENGKSYEHKLAYLNFGPRLLFNNFILGFDIGIPLSAKIDGASSDTDKFNLLTDIKFGYKYRIYQDETAQVNVFAELGYMLNGVFSDFDKDDPLAEVKAFPTQKISNAYNPRAASVQIGFNYLFNVEALSEEEE